MEACPPEQAGHASIVSPAPEAQLDGVEVRSLVAHQSDADVFQRSRGDFERGCSACHSLYGPWDSANAPDQWEGMGNEILDSEGADEFLSRAAANRTIDYLRLISIHPAPTRDRPASKKLTRPNDNPRKAH